jgi:hypothetical protein
MRKVLLNGIALFALVSAAESSESGRIGLSAEAGGKTMIGFIFFASDRLAVHPVLAFSELQTDNVPVYIEPGEDFPVFETTERILQMGIGLNYYLMGGDRDIRPYFGGDFLFGRHNIPFQTMESEIVVYKNGVLHDKSLRVFSGLQAAITHWITVFGEIGLEHTTRERFAFGGRKLHSRLLSSYSSGVGIIIFFR